MPETEFKPAWRKNDPALEADAIAFWQKNKFLPKGVVAEERAKELCGLVYRDGEVIAVSTIIIKDNAAFSLPHGNVSLRRLTVFPPQPMQPSSHKRIARTDGAVVLGTSGRRRDGSCRRNRVEITCTAHAKRFLAGRAHIHGLYAERSAASRCLVQTRDSQSQSTHSQTWIRPSTSTRQLVYFSATNWPVIGSSTSKMPSAMPKRAPRDSSPRERTASATNGILAKRSSDRRMDSRSTTV